jgi:hypothetical protein
MICNETGCKKMRLLEKECEYLKNAIKEYKINKVKNSEIRNHLYKKLKAIINKYKMNQYRIDKISCDQIEKEIVGCFLHMKTM